MGTYGTKWKSRVPAATMPIGQKSRCRVARVAPFGNTETRIVCRVASMQACNVDSTLGIFAYGNEPESVGGLCASHSNVVKT
jgi:hypothetical protein